MLACVYVLIPRGFALISKFMADKPGISGVRLKLTRRILRSRLILDDAVFLGSAKHEEVNNNEAGVERTRLVVSFANCL